MVDKYRERPPISELDDIHATLGRFHDPHPVCPEVVEAEFLGLRLLAPDDYAARIALLEPSVKRFPDQPVLAYLLVQERDASRDHGVDRGLLEPMVGRSPDDWFPYVRLSFATMLDNGVGATSLAWLNKGLVRSPDSTILNYLSALFLLREGRYQEAVEPAARLLAGLFETSNYHHNWDMGIAILQSALAGKSLAFSKWPTGEDAAALFQSVADPASLGPGMTTAHGCFAPGSGFSGDTADVVQTRARPPRALATSRAGGKCVRSLRQVGIDVASREELALHGPRSGHGCRLRTRVRAAAHTVRVVSGFGCWRFVIADRRFHLPVVPVGLRDIWSWHSRTHRSADESGRTRPLSVTAATPCMWAYCR